MRQIVKHTILGYIFAQLLENHDEVLSKTTRNAITSVRKQFGNNILQTTTLSLKQKNLQKI